MGELSQKLNGFYAFSWSLLGFKVVKARNWQRFLGVIFRVVRGIVVMFRVNNEASNPLFSHERSVDALRILWTQKCPVCDGQEVCVYVCSAFSEHYTCSLPEVPFGFEGSSALSTSWACKDGLECAVTSYDHRLSVIRARQDMMPSVLEANLHSIQCNCPSLSLTGTSWCGSVFNTLRIKWNE